MKTAKNKKTPTANFSASIGDKRKAKLKRIAEAKNRSMNGQLCAWIDESPDPAKYSNGKQGDMR